MVRTTYYHADEVAALLNRPISDIYNMLKSGELKGYQTKSNRWLINKDQPLLQQIPTSGSSVTPKPPAPISKKPKPPCTKALTQFAKPPAPTAKVRPSVNSENTFYSYIKNAEHQKVLLHYMQNAKKSISIASANLKNLFIMGLPILKILNKKVGEGVATRIIFSNPNESVIDSIHTYENLSDTNLFYCKECVRNHAKLYIFDDEIAYVGSANLTNAALGGRSDNKRNFEAGIITSDKDLVNDALKHFNEIWSTKFCINCQSKKCKSN